MAALDDFMAELAALTSTESTVAKLRRKIQAAAAEYQAAVAVPEPPPAPPRLVRCVNDHPIWYRGDTAAWRALYADGRVQAVRADIPWDVVNSGGQPPAGYETTPTIPAQFNSMRVEIIDAWAAMMRDLGIRVTLVIGGAPAWASNGSATAAASGLGAGHEEDYAAFCAWAVRRWRPEAVECWNEPAGYWAWAPSGVNYEHAGLYAGMLAAAHRAVKDADPTCLVLCGSLFSAGQDARDQTYLRNLYANGGGTAFDVMAVHAYSRHCNPVGALATWQPPLYDGTRGSLLGVWEATVRPVMAANGDSAKPVWFNEAGVKCGPSGDATREQQAATVGAWFGQVAAGTVPEQVERVYYYTFIDVDVTGDHGWGLVRNDGAPSTMPTAAQLVRQPAFTAFANA